MDTELLIIDDESEIIIEVDTDVEVLEAAAQGPRGPQGIPGPAGGATTVTVGATPISGHCAVALDAASDEEIADTVAVKLPFALPVPAPVVVAWGTPVFYLSA